MILFAATSEADFNVASSAYETSSSLRAAYVSECFKFDMAETAWTPTFPPQLEIGVSQRRRPDYSPSFSATIGMVVLADNAGTPLFRLAATRIAGGSSVADPFDLSVQAWDGAAWVELFAVPSQNTGVLYRYDLHVVIGTAGSVELRINDVVAGSFSGDTDLVGSAGVAQVGLNVLYDDRDYVSSIIVADEATHTMEMFQLRPTGAGASSQWGGTYADIDDFGIDDTNAITAGAFDATSTFAFGNMPAGWSTGYTVEDVRLAGRGRHGAGAQDVHAAVKSGATTYERAAFGYGEAYGPKQVSLTTDPATGAAWTVAAIDAAEFGVKLKEVV